MVWYFLGYTLKRNKHAFLWPFSFLAGWHVVRAGATILVLEMKLRVENERNAVRPPTYLWTEKINFYYAVLDWVVSLLQ